MKNSEVNKLFLRSTTPQMKDIILSNIAAHYGMSLLNAEIEVTEGDAEEIIEYVTGSQRNAIYLIYQRFLSTMKTVTAILVFALCVSSCVTAQKQKTVLCPKQTPNQFLMLWAKQLGIKNPDTSQVLFVKPTRKHLPRLGDVIITDGKMYIIIDKPTPIYGKAGQTIFNGGDPSKNGGVWVTWWKYRVAGQSENCRTVIARSNADTKIQYYTRLSKF